MKIRRSQGFGVLGATISLAAALGAATTFAATLAGGALVHLNVPAVRRLIVHEVTGLLEPQFKGRLVLHHVERIDLRDARAAQVTGVRAELFDPDARRSALVDGVAAPLDLDALLRSLVTAKAPLRIDVRALRVPAADVALTEDREGVLGLVRAFEPRTPSEPKADGDGVSVTLGEVTLEHVWVHGAVSGSPTLDLDLDGARGWLRVTPATEGVALALGVTRAELTARRCPRREPTRRGPFQLAMPSDSGRAMGLGADFRGDVGGLPAVARARLDGAHLEASLDVPRVSSEKIRAMVPEAPLHEEVTLHAEARGDLPHVETSVRLELGRATVTAEGDVVLGDAVALSSVAIEARHVDARAFSPSAPPTDVSFDLTSRSMTLGDAGPSGTFTLGVLPGQAAGQRVPAMRGGHALRRDLRARGHVSEPGAPSTSPRRSASRSRSGLRRRASRAISAHPRVGPIAHGSAKVHTKGTLLLASSTVRARHCRRERPLAPEPPSKASARRGPCPARSRGPSSTPPSPRATSATRTTSSRPPACSSAARSTRR